MAMGYMPRGDGDALAWMKTFAGQIVASPEQFFISHADAMSVAQAVERYAAALQRAVESMTRTAGSVADKDSARRFAELACRPLYLRIKADPRIDARLKVDAGIRIDKSHRTSIAAPSARPMLLLDAITLGSHSIRFVDHDSQGRAKPTGVTTIQIFRHFADDDTNHPPELLGCFTRSPVRFDYHPIDNGKTAVYTARWMNRKGQAGPRSDALQIPVVATSILPGRSNIKPLAA